MTLANLLLSSRGRIGRRSWWGVLVATFLLYLSGYIALGSFGDFDFTTGRASHWLGLGLEVVLAYPAFCVCAKRFQDRGKSGWLALFGAATGLLDSIVVLVFGTPDGDLTLVEWVVLVPAVGVFLWYLVELGCLPGTSGENRYGPDPLPRP